MKMIFGTCEGYVCRWFEQNYKKLGFISISSMSNKTPDYYGKTEKGSIKGIEIEFFSSDFLKHKLNINLVDIILCAHKDIDIPNKTVVCLENFGVINEFSSVYQKRLQQETTEKFKELWKTESEWVRSVLK